MEQGSPLSTDRTRGARRRGPADAHFRGFLFADLRGYTAFVERRGNEAAAKLLRDYRALVRRVVGRHEGAEIRTEGDSFFVVFPSATSAVRGGLALVAAARSGAGGDPAGGIRVGVGIHAGETVETTEGFVGAAINVAARVCSEAAAGEVVVTETVRELTGTMLSVTFEPMGRRRMKGVGQPVALYRVLDPEAAHAGPPLARVALGGRARTVLGPVFVLGTALVLALAFVLPSGTGSPRPSGLGGTPMGSSQSAPGATAESPVATAGEPFLPALTTTAKIAIPANPVWVAAGRDAVWVAYFTGVSASGRPVSSVARVDPRTNAVVATIAFDSAINAIVADGDDAWVALSDVNQVQRINGRTNEPDPPVVVSEPHDIAAGAGSIWVTVRSAPRATTELEGRQTRVVRVDPKRNHIVATIDLGRIGQEVEVAADGVWVSGDAIWHVDPATDRVVDTFNVSSPRLTAGTGRLAVGAGSLWLVAGGETIIRLDPATGRVQARFPGPPGLRTIAFGQRSLWATGSGASLIELLQIDPASNRPIAVAQLPYGGATYAGGPPGGGVTGFGSMWVCVPAAGELWRFQPRG